MKNIFKNIIFIGEKAGQNDHVLTQLEKTKLKTNLKKALENEKINEFNNSIGGIHSFPKSKYNELMNKFGIENYEPFDNPSRIIVVTNTKGEEIAVYLETPGYINSIDYKINDRDIQDFITASIEYKLGIKVLIDKKYLE